MPPQCDITLKARILAKLEEGWSVRATAQYFQINKNTVFTIKKRWSVDKTLSRKSGTGKTKISTPEQDKALLNILRECPKSSAQEARIRANFPGSQPTASRRIRNSNLENRTDTEKDRKQKERLLFCLQYVNRDLSYWKQVIFTDVKVFQLTENSKLVFHRPNEHCSDNLKVPVLFSVNVWGWMSFKGVGVCWKIVDRFTTDNYVDILEYIILPSVKQLYPEGFKFLYDKYLTDSEPVINTWFESNDITTLSCPDESPDLNPMGNIWTLIVQKFHKKKIIPQSADQLWNMIEDIWNEISEDQFIIHSYILSIPKRLEQNILNKSDFIEH